MATDTKTDEDYAVELRQQHAQAQMMEAGLDPDDRYEPTAGTDVGKINQAKNRSRALQMPAMGAKLYKEGKKREEENRAGGKIMQHAGRYLNRGGHLAGALSTGDSEEIGKASSQFGKASRLATAQIIRGLWMSMEIVYSIPFSIIGLDIFFLFHFLFPRLFSGVGEAFVLTPFKMKNNVIARAIQSKAELGGNMVLLFLNAILFFAVIAFLTIVAYIAYFMKFVGGKWILGIVS